MKKAHHPKGLYPLFFTEMWERFGFYLMLGIFLLYMTDKETGGLGFDLVTASEIYGTYIALVYFAPFFGGLLADRWLGYRKSIVLGGVLMSAGYFMLALPGMAFFYGALALIIVGNGFFKPNISTIVGRLYKAGDPLRDAGYNIFYMGINIGAFICNFVAALLRNTLGWPVAFASAGVGMAIGVVIFLFYYKSFAKVDVQEEERRQAAEGQSGLGRLLAVAFVPGLVAGAIAYIVAWQTGQSTANCVTIAFFAAMAPVVGFFIWLTVKSSKDERPRMAALLSIFAVIVFFWMIFHQNGAVLTVLARDNTERHVGASTAKVLAALKMEEKAPPSYFPNASPQTPRPAKSTLQVVSAAEHERTQSDPKAMETYRSRGKWPVSQRLYDRIYARAGPKTPTIKPGESLPLISTELYQSINPAFIILLTPLIVLVWAGLRRRKLEPTTPGKLAWGMVLTASSVVLLLGSAYVSGMYESKVSSWWLIGTYFIFTAAELCLSPMGLSIVSKLAPKRIGGLMMGGWFLATAIGNKLAGFMSGLYAEMRPDHFYYLLLGLISVSAVATILMLPWLKRVMKDV